MSCVIEDVTDKLDPTAFDKELGSMLVKHDSNVTDFLVTVLGFLHRKSNFFKEGDPKKRVLEAFKQVCVEGACVWATERFSGSPPLPGLNDPLTAHVPMAGDW